MEETSGPIDEVGYRLHELMHSIPSARIYLASEMHGYVGKPLRRHGEDIGFMLKRAGTA
jgi:hypothetical protein